MIESLPVLAIEGHRPSRTGNADHPMRVVTRRIAGLEHGGWDDHVSREVKAIFDELAAEWHTRVSPERTEVVRDAIDRGLARLLTERRLCVEVGSGIGTYSGLVAEEFETVFSVELSWEMLTRAGDSTFRVLADGARLPVADSSVDSIVLINAFLFPGEVTRVLKERGVLLWVNTSGEQTPIHLSTGEVTDALPFSVEGVESRAGAGTWCALRRLESEARA